MDNIQFESSFIFLILLIFSTKKIWSLLILSVKRKSTFMHVHLGFKRVHCCQIIVHIPLKWYMIHFFDTLVLTKTSFKSILLYRLKIFSFTRRPVFDLRVWCLIWPILPPPHRKIYKSFSWSLHQKYKEKLDVVWKSQPTHPPTYPLTGD